MMPTKQSFTRWLNGRDEGRFQYYEGNLLSDRFINWQLYQPELNVPVDNIARAAWNAHMDGKVYLTQQRLGTNKFAYFATKRT